MLTQKNIISALALFIVSLFSFVANTAHASSAVVTAGQTVLFTSTVQGPGPFTYQWYKDGSALTGITSANYQINNVQAAHAGVYTVVISNASGSTTSDNATISFGSVVAPVITTQPLAQVVTTGAAVTFTAAASGTPTPTFQWKLNGTNIAGATNASLTLNNVQTISAGLYTVVATNSAGSATSLAAALTVNLPSLAPSITTQPASQTVTAGATVTFSAAASGTPAPTYQWRRNGTNISGATSASLTLTNVQSANAGTYTLVATNLLGSATSNGATLTVNAGSAAPAITTQPVSQTVTAGASVTFSAAASGSPAPTYQWRRNGTNLSGATSATLSLTNVQSANAGTYTVVATNSAGSATSSGAVLTVNASASVSAPSGLTATAASGAIILGWTDNSNNEGGFEIQYSIDGTNFLTAGTVGANVRSYTDSGLPDSTTYTYRVRAYLNTTYSGYSNSASATTPAATVNWTQADIGSVGLAGSGSVGATTATISAAGADIWGGTDSFRFVYQPWNGDGVMITRVASLDNTDPWAKAGIMFRESLAANARAALVFVTPGQGVNFQDRTSTGGMMALTRGPSAAAPYWLKLVRAGNVFTSYASTNGTTWTQVGTQTIAMSANAYVGFAVCSHNTSVRAIGVFDQFNLGTGSQPVTVSAPSGLTATAASGAITLGWSDNSNNEGGFEIQYSIDGTNFLTADTVGADVRSYTDTGLPDSTTYTYRVRAYLGSSVSGFSNTASATTPVASVNWTQADIGSVGLAGSGSMGPTTATISAAGADIWGGTDSFRFAYQPWTGDGVMIARVVSMDNTDPWAKAGIMFRESLAANARAALMFVTPGQGVNFQDRTSTGGMMALTRGPFAAAPYWIKLVRVGNVFTGYASTNGTTWTQVGTQTIAMGANAYVGFAVCSHNTAVRNIAVFSYQPITAR